jgi:hypothetical protein
MALRGSKNLNLGKKIKSASLKYRQENIFAELTENRLTGGGAREQNLYIPLRVGGGVWMVPP